MKKISENEIRSGEEERRLMEEERARQSKESEEGGNVLEGVKNIEDNNLEVPLSKDTTVLKEGI